MTILRRRRGTANDTHTTAVAQLRDMIASKRGERLPAERELCRLLDISRPRLRSILAQFQEDGLIDIRLGSGAYAIGNQVSSIKTIALLIDEDLKIAEDPFISQVIEEILHVSDLFRVRCSVRRISIDPDRVAREDGVILIGRSSVTLLEHTHSDHPPIVTLFLTDPPTTDHRVSHLTLNDSDAGRTAASKAIERGARSIIFAGKSEIPASANRLKGVQDVCEKATIPCVFCPTSLNYNAGVRLGRDVQITKPHTSIIATNDWLALGIRSGITGRNLSENIGIVSFDGLSITSDPIHEIVSLAVPINDIAKDAISELQRLSAPTPASGRTVVYSLTERQL